MSEEITRGEIFRLLRNWMNLNVEIDSVASIRALAEVLQDRIDKIDLTDGEKGDIVQELITDLRDANKVELAVSKQINQFLRDGKTSTKH